MAEKSAGRLVQAGDEMEFLAAGLQENLRLPSIAIFFQRFQAVAGEARTHDVDPLAPCLRQFLQGRRGIYGCSHSALPKRD